LIILSYAFWANSSRTTSDKNIYPRYVIGEVENIGKNIGKGNIIALSPYVHTYDFSSQEAFYNMLHYYFNLALQRNLINDSTIIILPEYIGTWLVAANEKKEIYNDTSLESAMKIIVKSNLGKFGMAYLQSNAKDKTKEAVFKMKADKMLDIYQSTFSKLAIEFKLAIVAGSIVLPNPTIKNGKIEIDKSGKLYNISAVFDASGNVLPSLIKKIFPIEDEKAFTCAANRNEIPVYKTNAGNLAVLICADSWYPENYSQLKNKQVYILAVPSFVSQNNSWSNKWKGYNGAAAPSDVDTSDINNITEHDAWIKYAMVGRSMKTDIKTNVNVFLRGDLWNLGSDGNTLVLTSKYSKPINMPSFFEGNNKLEKTGSIINVWLQ
jgi:predicted amidohydrolase